MGEQVLPFLEAPRQLHQRLNSQAAVSQGDNSALSWCAAEPGFWRLVVIIYSHFTVIYYSTFQISIMFLW